MVIQVELPTPPPGHDEPFAAVSLFLHRKPGEVPPVPMSSSKPVLSLLCLLLPFEEASLGHYHQSYLQPVCLGKEKVDGHVLVTSDVAEKDVG